MLIVRPCSAAEDPFQVSGCTASTSLSSRCCLPSASAHALRCHGQYLHCSNVYCRLRLLQGGALSLRPLSSSQTSCCLVLAEARPASAACAMTARVRWTVSVNPSRHNRCYVEMLNSCQHQSFHELVEQTCVLLLTQSVCAGVHEDNLWGDINAVNLVPWPVLELRATWNRFRILGDRDTPFALAQHHMSVAWFTVLCL